MDVDDKRQLKFGDKATYKIKVEGKLDPSLSGILGGMSIETQLLSGKHFISTLTGSLADQAALSGILNTLYEMHLSVISVKCIDINDVEM